MTANLLNSWLSFKGEIAALAAAFLWAVSTVIFGRLGKRLSPVMLNLAKGILAIALISLTLLLRQSSPAAIEPVALVYLLLSGVIGIGLGDTAYFSALNHLGPRRVLLMESLSPPMGAFLAWIFLSEVLEIAACLGIVLTLLGVSWVISERVPNINPLQSHPWRGVLVGILAALGQAVGVVLSRAALADSAIAPLWSTLLRLLGGTVTLLVLLLVQKRLVADAQPLRSPRVLSILAVAAVLGTYLALWLQQTALKFAPTGIAQSLMATSPLFILPIALLLGDRVSLRAIGGVGVALGGVWLLFAYGQ
ncbi:MAG: DMT family transporter [Leptolyngbyaceae cyanobacterium SM1_1_3]|nr:DMT family transporter [Leptolyngbyaceae cyanobacterium SM1_1_3]NJN03262.1 DMT family transporter [Leptolyngbyaceae cyanobacterium RM1_1_2]